MGQCVREITMSELSDQDHAFFKENGYLIVREAVSKASCDAVIEDIFAFLKLDPHDSDGWYRPPLEPGRCTELYHTQAMWNNRQNPRLYGAFAELLGKSKLWCSLDRVSFKPPRHRDHPEWYVDGFLHWDYHDMTLLPIPFIVQGVLCLTDTAADQGGFQCVPGAHKDLVREARPGEVLKAPDLKDLSPVPVPAKGGDLIIWHRALPHGNSRNHSSKPRLAQYISMAPAQEDQRRQRMAGWKQRCAKSKADASVAEDLPEPADIHLTPLGRRLLGIDRWG